MWHTKSVEEIYKLLKTGIDGLSSKESKKRLEKDGYNELEGKKRISLFKMIFMQFTDKMILILFVAAILSFFLHEYLEAIVILVIIFINIIVSVVQEKKAMDAVAALKNMNAPHARVIRDGIEQDILARDIVVGDVVLLEDGMVVPADIRLVETHHLKIDESALTGESEPVQKEVMTCVSEDSALGDRMNMAYSSSIVMYGTGKGIVTEIGMNTEVGKIATLLNEQKDMETPLKRKLEAVGKNLSIVGILISIFIFIIGLLYHKPVLSLLMISISLAISVIPEGLPATATIVMALGVERMARKNALVKKLPAVETLGNASVICTDKTGTLTQNKMMVTNAALYDSCLQETSELVDSISNIEPIIYAGMLCNNASLNEKEELGDPTEISLLLLGKKYGFSFLDMEEKYPKLFEQPFDSDRKRMSTIHKIKQDYTVYTKGATEEVLEACTHILKGNTVIELTEQMRYHIVKTSEKMSREALRVLAFAYKKLENLPSEEENIENDLIFIGLVGMIDPPRIEAKRAIKTCHEAGIRVIMITGDHKITAMEIGRSLGIYRDGDLVIDGNEMNQLSDEILKEKVKDTSVFARVSPSDKLRIVRALKQNREIIAMTGDGVNDSPALKEADIGVAMGITGTDVAKEAADMILLDDNFTTIELAIREGRRVYRNIQKVIQFLLAGNISEVLTIFIAILFNWNTPILAVHILLINLVTDTLPALALGVDPENENNMKQQPIKTDSLFEPGLIQNIIFHGILLSIISLSAYRIGLQSSYEVAVTMTFLTLSLSQIIHSLNQHSTILSIFSKRHAKNKYLYAAMAGSILVLGFIIFIPALAKFFSIVSLTSVEWLTVITLSLIPLIIVELVKSYRRNQSIK